MDTRQGLGSLDDNIGQVLSGASYTETATPPTGDLGGNEIPMEIINALGAGG